MYLAPLGSLMSEPYRTETVSELPPPRRYLVPGTVIGERYEVRGPLGRGGHASAYQVWDREVRQEVALKLLHVDRATPANLARLKREVGVAREVAHPRVVRIFEFGTSTHGAYLTMELVAGASLRERLSGEPLPVDEAIGVAIQLFEGLAALHEKHVVHRDVKPGNILLTETGEVKLADFGLARRLDREETRLTTAGVAGTLAYLSPEQMLGEPVGPPSDLYSAGLVLYEMLTGAHPSDSEALVEAGAAQGRAKRNDPKTLRPEVPAWLSAIVVRLLERRPEDRYSSAGAVLGDLMERRSPARLRLRGRSLRAAEVALLLLLALARGGPEVTFSHLVAHGETGIAAVSTSGETLWRYEGVDRYMADRMALARITPRGPRLIAIVLARPGDWSPEAVSTLAFLEPHTGRVVRQITLPSGAGFFPDDPPRFSPSSLTALDLSDDGVDEVLVSYTHVPEAPSYTVLYAPRSDRARVVFYARGGQRFQGATDLDGDGTTELIFAGVNNGWNWVNTVAAVRLDLRPWADEHWRANPAGAPDVIAYPAQERQLLWYATIPRGHLQSPFCLGIHNARRELTIRYESGKTWKLGFNGFPPGTPGAAEREEARREAYHHLQEAERLRRAGALDLAMGEAQVAFTSAERARESWLSQYAERLQAKLLAAQGKIPEAEARFASLMERAEDAPEVAYDAAVAFHLAGDLRRAVTWYARGIGRDSAMGAGKSKHEFLKGEVLALVEGKRYEEAMRAVDRFGATYPPFERYTWPFREYVRWRAGERPEVSRLTRIPPNGTDLNRYWELEFEFASGGDPQDLLPRVDRFLAELPETRAELLSLRAELLARLDRANEAAEAAQAALELVRGEKSRSIVARAHEDLVAARARRLRAVEQAAPAGRATSS